MFVRHFMGDIYDYDVDVFSDLYFVIDVQNHVAIDTIDGWMK